MASINDKVSRRLAPTLRKIQDLTLLFAGTQTQVIRIAKSTLNALPGKNFDAFGYYNEKLDSEVLDDVGILYPSGMLEIFIDINNRQKVVSYDMIDILPFQMFVRFNGEAASKSVDLQEGDLIIDILRDEYDNKIPIVMEITKFYGQFYVKDIVAKKCDLVIKWDQLDQTIKNTIDTYINTLV